MNKRFWWALLPLLFVTFPTSSFRSPVEAEQVPFIENPFAVKWADSVFNSLTPDERLGQLFMIAAYSNKGADEKQKIASLIQKYKIGGLIFMQGGPARQAALTNYYQSISKVPLMIGIDGEWGLAMRLDSTLNFPRQQMLGAIQDDSLIYQFGAEVARQCKRIGVNINFAPDIDINNNPLNPVIGDRSFGDNKYNVARKGILYAKGMQDNGVLACAKHFPGHGDTDKDSHKTLPTVTASASRLDSLELYPFRELINAGVGSIMVAHLFVPALDTTPNRASTLSPLIVTDLLKTKLGFEGLIITDALNMKGVSDYYEPGEVDAHALMAGNDVLLFSGNVGAAIVQIKAVISSGKITQDEVDARVKKILRAKYQMGLNNRKPVELKNLNADLNNPKVTLLKQKLIENALTLVRNKGNMIPFTRLDTFKMASVAIGAFKKNEFQKTLQQYAPVTDFQIDKNSTKEEFVQLLNKLKDYNCVFVSFHNLSKKYENYYGITQSAETFLDALRKQKKVVTAVFGTPYALKFFEDENWLLECYNDESLTQKFAAQLLFGGIKAKGKLPVTVSDKFRYGSGLLTANPVRLKYTIPEEVGIAENKLYGIDSIVNEAILTRAFPGCQVLVAKDGKVIYQKSFGFFTYDKIDSVHNDDLYDLASVTKVAATTLAVMKLYQENKISLYKPIVYYMPELAGSNKENIFVHELLTHQAGLKAWIPFYKETLNKDGSLNTSIYSQIKKGGYSVNVSQGIYMNKDYIDTMWSRIVQSAVTKRGQYLYSDLDFFFLQQIAEKQSGTPLDQYVDRQFYSPLGLSTMCYNPLNHFSADRIVPSNYDNTFRKELLQGYVHDPGAAMLGGVGGHAGLFSNANDVAVLQQMLLNNGTYGGVRYLDSVTVEKFTTQAGKICRRGLGFDKPEPNPSKPSPCAAEATCNTYGHQGFTGTCVWTDPVYNLVYVFLSNRTFPDDQNQKINTLNVRKSIQEVIYKSFLNEELLSGN